MGVKRVRLRKHEEIARIEVEKEDLSKILENKENIIKKLNELGFKYITLDLNGIKSGSFDK